MDNSSTTGEIKSDFLHETPASILKWSADTFGPRTILEIATRASTEVNELMCGIINQGNVKSIHDEFADCGVMLWQVAELLGIPARPRFQTPPNIQQRVELVAAQFNRRFGTVIEELILDSMRTPTELKDHSLGVARLVHSDVLKLLELLAYKFGIELAEHVDVKMVINRARNWQRLGNGNYQHTEAQA